MDRNLQQQMYFEANRKSTGAAYLLWFFLGFLGAHRFYIGRTGTGVVQLVMCLSIIGIIPLAFWWLIDAFLIPEMVRDENIETIHEIERASGGEYRQLDHSPMREDDFAPREGQRPASRDPRVEEIREMSRRR